MISSLACSATTQLACLLVVGGAAACSMVFPFELRDRDAAAGAELDAAVDAPLDAGENPGIDAGTDAGIDAGCDPEACPEGLPTCLALRDRCPCAASGFHVLDPDGDGPGFPAYCDMDKAGGGWTLVGRSVAGGAAVAFGWGVDEGTVDEEGAPYSLDVVSRGFPATELLVGSHGEGMTWGPNVYRIILPENFLSDYADKAADVSSSVVVIEGECAPALDNWWMLRSIGFTSWPGGFFFRDVAVLEPSGLGASGWNLADQEGIPCDRSGLLDGLQGMLFVR